MMFKKIQLFLLVVVCAAGLNAQVTILDFETPATSTTFQYFGSSLEPMLTNTIANPNSSGINTSATVLEFKKPANALTYAGAFSNPNPVASVDLTAGGMIKIKVHTDHPGNLSLKLEGSTTTSAWRATQVITTLNEWVELSFDPNALSQDGPAVPATGNAFPRVTLFFDFDSVFTTDQTYYLDDIAVTQEVVCSPVLDFEDPATSTTFQYFGSSLEPMLTNTIANPNSSGINTSATVLEFKKPANAFTYAGAFSNPDPTTSIDLTSGGMIKVKVHTDHPGNLSLKLENSTTTSAWRATQLITTLNEWVELSFDPNALSQDGPAVPATGNIFPRVTLFFDFDSVFTTEQTYYLDDLQVCSSGGISTADVTFQVNMNNYTGPSFSTVSVIGDFNAFSDANPMTDTDGDGIYTTTVSIPVGSHEYKYMLDNFSPVEDIAITASCAQVTIDGENIYINRKLGVSGDVVLDPVCFGSCYNCGESVKITYDLGLNGATADPGGVYLAGGAEFGAPNIRFRMYDNDGDGVYSIQIERERGYGGFYTFTNGACGDFSCKENIAGLPCAQPQNFNDRFLSPVQQDTVVATCLATCATASDCTTGSTELAGAGSWMELVPTLASNDVRILFHELTQSSANVQIMDLTGRIVWQQQWRFAPAQVHLQVSDWQKGMYFITAENGGRRITGRFVKM